MAQLSPTERRPSLSARPSGTGLPPRLWPRLFERKVGQQVHAPGLCFPLILEARPWVLPLLHFLILFLPQVPALVPLEQLCSIHWHAATRGCWQSVENEGSASCGGGGGLPAGGLQHYYIIAWSDADDPGGMMMRRRRKKVIRRVVLIVAAAAIMLAAETEAIYY